MTETTLVLGGTGKTGRRVADRLIGGGLRVRIGSRSATPCFDWDEPSTWASVLRDVEVVYLAYYPGLGPRLLTFTGVARERTRVPDGRNAYLSSDVQRVLGRPARDFADYARSAEATGVWSAA